MASTIHPPHPCGALWSGMDGHTLWLTAAARHRDDTLSSGWWTLAGAGFFQTLSVIDRCKGSLDWPSHRGSREASLALVCPEARHWLPSEHVEMQEYPKFEAVWGKLRPMSSP